MPGLVVGEGGPQCPEAANISRRVMAQPTPEGGRGRGARQVELEVPVTCGESQPPPGAFSHSDEADSHTGALRGMFMGRAVWPRTVLPGRSMKGLVCMAGVYQSVGVWESPFTSHSSHRQTFRGWKGKRTQAKPLALGHRLVSGRADSRARVLAHARASCQGHQHALPGEM